ncbi:T9SS type A sorting domain-containing protein, partial [Bacteroidales bacterium OttesenSCG-928-I21]|nr:T9SS type A sorting domain-containing protein [Bacteroidales bacterium OttesenSCG-928-I21]
EFLKNLPELELPPSCKNRILPYAVNNSETQYYRTPFPQDGLSCGQASSVGMCFTYEMATARNLPADVNENLYPTHFVFNWANGDYGTAGASYYHTFEVLKKVGTPNQADYGGTPHYGGLKRWMSGYDLYYSAMHNRMNNAYKIDVSTAEGIQKLKNWMYDRGNGTHPGGCAITYSANRYPQGTLPEGTECEGMYVLTSGSMSSSHSFTFLGYNDSIRYDYNGDGRYTNDEDINGDGVVDMRDWEIGGLIMSETYFGATAWGNGGYCFVTYKAIADGYLWNYIVHVMDVNPNYEPLLTAKVNMTYTHRKRIKVYAGISTNPDATTPEHIIDFPIFSYQGGDSYMQGGTTEEDKTIEFGLDLTPLLNYAAPNSNVKYFFQIYENDPENTANGTINSFSIINYSNETPIETICNQTNVDIINNSITSLCIETTHTYDKVQITTTELSSGAVMSNYSHQMEATGGSEPYLWSFDTDYKITKSTSNFPTGGNTTSTNSEINLNFDFDFFGETINKIYVNSKGLIVFKSNFSTTLPYANVGLETQIFYNQKCIAPYHTQTIEANGIKCINESDFITIIWITNVMSYSATLHEDGRIEFCYTNAEIPSNTPYACGISYGDSENYAISYFDNIFEINDGTTYTFSKYEYPEDFEISTEGLITGAPTREYGSELFHIKIKDNNGLTDKISLPFMTEGVILEFIPHTVNNNIIEYNENVDLDIIITNPIDTDLSNIIITASCSDQYITLLNNTANIATLASQSNETIENAISFHVNSSIPNNYQFLINFTIATDNDTWEYFRLFQAYAPEFEIINTIANDNNDNIISTNETVNFSTQIKNIGDSDGTNLTVTAISNDPNTSIISNPQTGINIEKDATQTLNFEISISDNIPETYNSNIELNISDENGFQRTVELGFIINTVKLDIYNILNTNFITPGEIRNFEVTLKNVGSLNARNINAVLSTTNTDITIIENENNFETILINESKTVNFSIQVSEYAQYGEQIDFAITITDNNGLNYNLPFSITIGIFNENFETENTEIEWIYSGNENWYIVDDMSFDGSYSLRSGNISDGETSTIETNIFVLIDAPISFAYKISSESNYDFLKFYVDGEVVKSFSGDFPWYQTSYILTAGMHNVKWEYSKDNSVARYSDAAWLDKIVFPPFNNTPPEFSFSSENIEQTVVIGEQIDNHITLNNIGGQYIDYNLTVRSAAPQSRSIIGTNISTNFESYLPGENYDITFVLNAHTMDSDWIKTVEIEFPEEFTVNSATNIVGASNTLQWYNITGAGATTIWSTSEQHGAIKNGETVEFVVNVDIDETFKNAYSTIKYKVIGDGWGNAPHQVASTIQVTNEENFWLKINPLDGRILARSNQRIDLNFDASELELGYYYADIVISNTETQIVIPVELNVVDEVSSLNYGISKNLFCYPNPIDQTINIRYFSDKEDVASIKLVDILGQEIDILDRKFKISTGENNLTYSISKQLSPGVYFLKFESKTDTFTYRIVKK